MPDQDSSATAGDNAGNSNSDTSTDTKNEGAANISDTSTENKKNEGANTRTFTQEEVNTLLAKERKDAERKAKMSEDERLKTELSDARLQLRERDTRDAVQTEASRLGAKNTGLIYKAVKDDLTFDKDGKPENLKDVLTQAKKDFPELFGILAAGSADGGEKGQPTARSMNDWMRGK